MVAPTPQRCVTRKRVNLPEITITITEGRRPTRAWASVGPLIDAASPPGARASASHNHAAGRAF
eukprot:scaffold5391_cov29-Tisochrysis_lutea.AAC.8